MSDPLLTSLCTICHREPPKYKCPRCGVRTCSLPCTKKHKAWASCSGERDPASFIPRERLLTDAGVDHDYNFISKIERAKERFEKKVVAEKGLVGEGEIRGPKRAVEDKRFEKVWYGDQLVHVPATRSGTRGGRWSGRGGGTGRDSGHARFDQQVRQRLRRHDIQVLTMPKGLSRQKENKTAWNRRTNTINWQVEWLLFAIDPTRNEDTSPTRICHKSLDEKPLHEALTETLEWYQSGAQKRKRAREEGDVIDEDMEPPPHKRPKPLTRRQKAALHVEAMISTQDSVSSTWPASAYTMQCSVTSQWSQTSSDPSVPRSHEEMAAALAKLRFFLLKPATPDAPSKGLIPLSSTDNLVEALAGRTIIEFPTLYVLGPKAPLPEGLGIASTERRSTDTESESEEDTQATNANRAPLRNTRHFEKKIELNHDVGSVNANRAPLRNNRLSDRRERGGFGRLPQKGADSGAHDDGEEGEINSEGEEVHNRRRAMGMRFESIADANNVVDEVDDGLQERSEEVPKLGRGLVDYGSSSGSEAD